MLETLSEFEVASGQIAGTDKNKIYFKTLSTKKCNKYKYRIFILHDLLKYHDPYIELAMKLINSIDGPIQIVLFDLKGHGLSTGTRGHIESYHEYITDIDLLLNSFAFASEEKRLLISEGFSALLVLDYFYTHHQKVKEKFLGIILANPAIKVKSLQNYLNKKEFSSFVPKALKKIRIPFITFSTQSLLRDSFLRYDKVDPLIMQNGSLQLVQEIYGLSQRIRPMPYLFDLPFLFLVNGKDALLDIPLVNTFFKGLSGEKSQIIEYDLLSSGALLLDDTEEKSGVIKSWLQTL